LFQNVAHINDFLYLGKHTSCFGHFVLVCRLSTFLSHLDITFIFLPSWFFRQISTKQLCKYVGTFMGPRSRESIQGPLMRQQAQLSIFFGDINLLSMENCAQSDDLGNWALVAPYLCVRFCIFDKPILEEYFF
jgi:hypothetical protein